MIADNFEILILSLVQGITEFLPVSSTAHLILISKFYELDNQNLLIDISLHTGSLLAILFFFRDDFFNFRKNKSLFLKIIIGTIPLLPAGYWLHESGLIHLIRNINLIAWNTLIFGILIYIADKTQISKSEASFKHNLFPWIIAGLFQIISLIPGVSRAGITITAGRFLGFNRVDSSKIAFYLSIPALLAVSIFGVIQLPEKSFEFNLLALIGIFLSFFFSYLTIKYFLKYIKKFSLTVFVAYRILLGIVLFASLYF